MNGEMVEDEVPLKQGDEITISKHILVWADVENDPAFLSCLQPKQEEEAI